MKPFSETPSYIFFNSRDELIRIKLSKVACIEADANYCHVIFINGAKTTLLTSLTNIEKLLAELLGTNASTFIRLGKKFIVNSRFIFQINVLKQKLVLTDFESPNIIEINISKEALKNLKNLYTGRK